MARLTQIAATAGAFAALGMWSAGVQADNGQKPRYGGTLEIATEYPTLTALSWDPHDFNWKVNQDALHLEQLLAGDLAKAKSRGGKFTFQADAWIPPEALRGELAESWELVDDPLSVVFRLRKGVM